MPAARCASCRRRYVCDPDLDSAEYDFGVILWQTGDAEAARKHLEIAARSNERAGETGAQEFLRKVNR